MMTISRVASRQITGHLQQRWRSWAAVIPLHRTANASRGLELLLATQLLLK